VGCVIAELMLG
jgi:glycogen synthase kinase 3 beta